MEKCTHFQGLKYWYWPNIKTAELCKVFKFSMTAAKLGQVLNFEGLVMIKANYCFIYFVFTEWQLFFFQIDFRLILPSVLGPQVFSPIRSFAHENRSRSEYLKRKSGKFFTFLVIQLANAILQNVGGCGTFFSSFYIKF